MSKPFFTESPEQSLARAFADHIVSWARQTRELDDPIASMLKKAAWHVSMAVSSGNSCLLLDDLDENGDETDIGIIRQRLFDSGVVGTPDLPETARWFWTAKTGFICIGISGTNRHWPNVLSDCASLVRSIRNCCALFSIRFFHKTKATKRQTGKRWRRHWL